MKSSFLFSRILPLTLLLSGPLLYSVDLAKPNIEKEIAVSTKQKAPQSPKKELTSEEDIEVALKSGKPAIIKVYANWCGACTMSEEPFNQASQNYTKEIVTCKLNSDNKAARQALEKKFGKIENLPTTILIDKEGKVRKEVGSRSAEEFESMFISLADKGSSKEGAGAKQAQTKEIKNQQDLDAALRSGRPFIIDAWAEWCGACEMSKEPLAKAHAKFADKVDLYLANTDNKEVSAALQKQFGKVKYLPTFILVSENGKTHRSEQGARSEDQFVQMILSLVSGKMQPTPKPEIKEVTKPSSKQGPKQQRKTPVQDVKKPFQTEQAPQKSKDIKNQQDLDAALDSGRPFIIKVWAEWCGACKISDAPFARAHEKYKAQVDAYSLDYDSPKARAAFDKKFGKSEGLPTIVLVTAEGKVQKELGSRDYDQFLQMFKKLASSPAAKAVKTAPAKKTGSEFGGLKRREAESKRIIDAMELDELLDDEDNSADDESDNIDDQDLD